MKKIAQTFESYFRENKIQFDSEKDDRFNTYSFTLEVDQSEMTESLSDEEASMAPPSDIDAVAKVMVFPENQFLVSVQFIVDLEVPDAMLTEYFRLLNLLNLRLLSAYATYDYMQEEPLTVLTHSRLTVEKEFTEETVNGMIMHLYTSYMIGYTVIQLFLESMLSADEVLMTFEQLMSENMAAGPDAFQFN